MLNTRKCSSKRFNASLLVCFLCLFSQFELFSQNNSNDGTNDSDLIDLMVQSNGYNNAITFTSANIKQFWVEKSVASKDNLISILLEKGNNWESVPLRIQLANVNEQIDCKVSVFSKMKDVSFSVLNDKLSEISKSAPENSFVDTNIVSSTFHLEDTRGLVFFVKFASDKTDLYEISRIVLSFSDNPNSSFHSSPGTLKINKESLKWKDMQWNDADESIVLTGKKIDAVSTQKIYASDSVITNTATVKNIGQEPTKLYFGYELHSKEGKVINNYAIPYKENKVLSVLSSSPDTDRFTVDSIGEWRKGCVVALNAKEDLSDFPNLTFLEGTIKDVNVIDENHIEIIMDKPIKNALAAGTKVRIQSSRGAKYLYTVIKDLQPGEETTIETKIQKNNNYYLYNSGAICKGCYYIVPVFMSYSHNPDNENTVLVRDYMISY